MPCKEKTSKMTVMLDKSMGGTHIGEVEFDMGDFEYGSYKYRTLNLKRSEQNVDAIEFEPEEAYLEIGLKGTRQDGLVQKRMSEIKKQMDSSIKDVMRLSMASSNSTVQENVLKGVQSQEIFQNIVQVEVDKIKKEGKEKMKEYEEKLNKKNKIINDLLTDSENIKTELTNLQSKFNGKKTDESKLEEQIAEAKVALGHHSQEKKSSEY